MAVSSSDEATMVARAQRELMFEIARSVLEAADQPFRSTIIEARCLAGYAELSARTYFDGETGESVRVPRAASNSIVRLRREMYQTGRGTWLSATFAVNSQGGVNADFNYDVEPPWSAPINPELYIQEIATFPRLPDAVPDWLKRRVADSET